MALSFQDKIRPVATSTASNLSFADKIRPVSATTNYAPPPPGDGVIKSVAKAIISPPATLLARPVQLAAMTAGMSNEEINKYNLGGLVAPVPTGINDVVQDVGRAGQTIAMGLTAPGTILASGALFGAGASLERQGTKALTTPEGAGSLALETAGTMAAGKVLDVVGRPLFGAVAGTVGKVVPKEMAAALSKMSQGLERYAAKTELPLVSKVSKPVAKAVTTGAEKFDTAINTTVRTGAESVAAKVTPAYAEKEVAHFFEGLGDKNPAYRNTRSVLDEAQAQGITIDDIKDVLRREKIYEMDNVMDGKRTTEGVADVLADETIKRGQTDARPLFEALDKITPKTTVSEVKTAIQKAINAKPENVLSPTQKRKMKAAVEKEYGFGSAEEAAGNYSPTRAYNAKIQRESKVYKESPAGGTTISDKEIGIQKQIEGKIFKDIILRNSTAEQRALIEAYFKEQQKRFIAANFLRSLDKTPMPLNIFEKGRRVVLGGAGALIGSAVGSGFGAVGAGGLFGAFAGAQMGRQLDNFFLNSSSPIKVALLRKFGVAEPEIYKLMSAYRARGKMVNGKFRLTDETGAVIKTPDEQKVVDAFVAELQRMEGVKMLPPPDPNVINLPGDSKFLRSDLPLKPGESTNYPAITGAPATQYPNQGGAYERLPGKNQFPPGTLLLPENKHLGPETKKPLFKGKDKKK